MSALSFLVFLLFSTFLFAAPPSAHAADGYAGSEKCEECHKEIYTGYRASGHPYKIQKIKDGQPPVYPVGRSSGVPRPPEGMDWKDISHVIGGYGWKARFMDLEGYILTGKAGFSPSIT